MSKKPDTENFEGNATLYVAQDGLYEVRGAVNFPLADGKMALRVNALYSVFDGSYDNAISGQALGGWDTKGVAAALHFTPNDTTDFTLRLWYSDDESEPRPSYYWGQAVPGRNTTLPLLASAVGLRLGVNQTGAPLPASIRYPSAARPRDHLGRRD